MASITTRAGKGSPLTNAEVDGNFTALNNELALKATSEDLGNAELFLQEAINAKEPKILGSTANKFLNGEKSWVEINEATTSVAGLLSSADKTKLNGVAAGATANDTDANLKNRANHTGTQTLSTISDAGTAASKDVPASGNAAAGEVVMGDDSRLSDSRSPTAHGHVSTDISDSTSVGRSVLTAADAGTARTAIGAGTSSFDGDYASLTGKPTIPSAPGDVGAAPEESQYITAGTTNTINLDSINKRVPITANTTLPANVTVAFSLGSAFILECDGTARTISRAGSDTITIDGKSGTVTSFTLKANTSVAMVRTSTTTWRAYGDI